MNPDTRPRVTLITSNGWGLGHLSRQIAIALAIDDRAEVTMFSFSRGLPLASQFGIRGEFCPSHTSPWIPRVRWNAYVEERFQAFISEVVPDVVLFDGVAPYPGVISALLDHPSISAGWLRRGMWLRGRSEVQLAKSSAFDFVIEPGDIAAEADNGPTAGLEAIRVPPVSLLEVVPMLDHDQAAAGLGLDPGKPALLFGLGSGQPGDAADARRAALERALEHRDWQVGVVSSPLSNEDDDGASDGVQLRGVYPLMRYLAAFDAAISAAGYNSVHELIPARIPSLFVPKSASQTDDQVARASFLAERRLAMVAGDDDVETVRRQVDSLLGDDRAGLKTTLETTQPGDVLGGAGAVAAILTSPPTGVRETGGNEWRQPGFKGWVKRVIGPPGVEWIRCAMGRTPPLPSRNVVSLDPEPSHGVARLLLSDETGDVSRSSDQPVEHILAGSSSAYRKARRDLIDEFYEVVD